MCTFDWQPDSTQSQDQNLLMLAVVLARNSKREGGHMGCVLTDPSGKPLVFSVNSSLYDLLSNKSDVHAEANAVCTAARVGLKLQGSHAYITMPPCRNCFGLLQAAGVSRIVTRHSCAHEDMREAAERLGIELVSPWTPQADAEAQQKVKEVWNSYIARHPEYSAQEKEQSVQQKQQSKQQKQLKNQQRQQQQEQQQAQQQGQAGGGSAKKRKNHHQKEQGAQQQDGAEQQQRQQTPQENHQQQQEQQQQQQQQTPLENEHLPQQDAKQQGELAQHVSGAQEHLEQQQQQQQQS